MDHTRVAIDVYLDEVDALRTMKDEVRQGLTSVPKQLPPKYFYDERGSWLFERITQLPEYYLTRAEKSVLEDAVGEIAAATSPEELVELGSGSAVKTHLLLDALRAEGKLRRYRPVDVSAAMAEHVADRLCREYPWLEIHALVADFERHLNRIPPAENRLVALLGSTIGNLLRPQAVALLRQVAGMLDRGGFLLLGTDLVKDKAVLEAAYNDSQGVTADFNRNVLRVINQRLGGDFDPEAFDHVAIYNEVDERIEMYLRSTSTQTASVEALDLTVSFQEGERMCTEVSCKYTRSSVESMLRDAGLSMKKWFTGPDRTFSLSLSKRGQV